MPGVFPYGFAHATVFAWPFASEMSFRIGATAVGEHFEGVLDRETDRLADGLIDYLRPRARGTSLEILRQVQESVWFASRRRPIGPTVVPLAALLIGAAQELIRFEGGRAVLRIDQLGEHRATARWRWVSFALSPDLLIAAYAAATAQEPCTDHVTVMPAHLWSFLDEMRLANLHLHFGAAVPFEVLWTNLLSRIGSEPKNHQRLDAGGFAPLGGGREFLSWLAVGALARAVLAGYLWQWQTRRAPEREDFSAYAARVAGRTGDPGLLMRALTAMRRGSAPPPYARVRPLLRSLTPLPRIDMSVHPRDSVARADSLARWLGGRDALPETHFLARALRRLLEPQADERFSRIFWQYVRLRGIAYRHVVQEPGTSGLDWFTDHYARISPLKGRLADAVMSTALELESRAGRLKSLEVRTSPESRWNSIRRLVEQVAWAPSWGSANPERGLVLHYLKQRRLGERRADHADPRQPAHGCRFGAYSWSRLKETIAIETALRFHPQLLVVLRGVDVCAVELSQPTWVFLPLVARLRSASLAASAALAPYGRIPPLRVTLHAGEDFRRLAEGLRRIHEPIEFGAVQAGDRLGHAVALGIAPEKWAEYANPAPQPMIERLDDLLWEVSRYRAGDLQAETARVERVRGEIDRLARQLYDRGYSLEDLIEARNLRHTPAVLRWLGYPFLRGQPTPSEINVPLRIVWEYLTSPEVYIRGNTPIAIPCDRSEVAMLHEAQRFLRRTLATMPVVVEANPSSNMLIGDLRLEDHPAFRLYPLPGEPAAEGLRVPIVFGDDDPLTFATTLADEFGHLYFSLVGRGISSEDAREWLRGIAANGMLARFTLPESVLRFGRVRRGRPRSRIT